jgi:hypothetical protein
MRRTILLALGFCLLSGILGCRGIAGPNWLHPGTADDQLRQAKRYNPYPETDMGASTTNVVPRGFEHPVAEPSRARWQLNGWQP